MAKKVKMTKPQQIAHEEKYIAFLKKALNSKNFKAQQPEEYAKVKVKYDKAKFRLKTLKM
jgi:hypothetical protein